MDGMSARSARGGGDERGDCQEKPCALEDGREHDARVALWRVYGQRCASREGHDGGASPAVACTAVCNGELIEAHGNRRERSEDGVEHDEHGAKCGKSGVECGEHDEARGGGRNGGGCAVFWWRWWLHATLRGDRRILFAGSYETSRSR